MSEKESTIRSVQRAINVLNCFSVEKIELSLTEISNQIDLAKSTTSRLLDTLEQNGLVTRKEEKYKYKLSYRMFLYGHIASKSTGVLEFSKPILEKLRNEIGESVSLYMIDNDKRVCIERLSSGQSIQHRINLGEVLPLTIGAGGKILLAFQKQFQIDAILKEQIEESKREIVDGELTLIKKEALATSFDERGVGVNAIATPIFDINHKVNYCLSVSGPSTRFTSNEIDKYKDKILDSSRKISYMLGYK